MNDALAHIPWSKGITLVLVARDIYFFIILLLDISCSTAHAIYLVFADLEFSGVKNLSRIFLNSFFLWFLFYYYYNNKTKTIIWLLQKPILCCYTVCTHNRIRSPRLAAFGRIETRWVREVGKFGPYLRYKDWLRRWNHSTVYFHFLYICKILFFFKKYFCN